MRRPNFCHISFAFILKFLNYLQAFLGFSIILYSIWMFNQWNHEIPVNPPPPPPSPAAPSPLSLNLPQPESSSLFRVLDDGQRFTLHAADMVSGFDEFDFNSFKLPKPWFIYSFMGVGIILCCGSFIGCIAAESIHGCCLCFYTIVHTLLLLLEAALVSFIVIDRRWEKDLPKDPTGELDSLRSFIEDNSDLCTWVGITVVVIQALALLLAIFLRAMVSTRKNEDDEGDYENVRVRTREPLLNPQSGQTSGSTHSDNIWSSRIREKYGLNNLGGGGDKYNLMNQNASSSSMKSK